METALVGFIGILIGIILNEYLRRKRRIETYSQDLFSKRLEIYENLYSLLIQSTELATAVIENEDIDREIRSEIWSVFLGELSTYLDTHGLYLNEEITVHIFTMMIGVEDIYDIQNEEEQKQAKLKFWTDYKNAKEMIRKEAGITEIENLFRSITKSKHESEYISYLDEMKKKMGK